jgi:hypothetical protein
MKSKAILPWRESIFCNYILVPKENGKISKIPSLGEKNIDLNKTPLLTYTEAKKKSKNIGFCFLNTNYFGIDIDNIDEIKDLGARIITYMSTYTENSISQNGVHVIARVENAPKDLRLFSKINNHIQLFYNYSYFALTENVIGGYYSEIKTIPYDIINFLFGENKIKFSSEECKFDGCLDPQNIILTDDEVENFNKNQNPYLKSMFLGENTSYPSFSELDYALIKELYRVFKDKSMVQRYYYNSPLYDIQKEKHKNVNYFFRTFNKVFLDIDKKN